MIDVSEAMLSSNDAAAPLLQYLDSPFRIDDE